MRVTKALLPSMRRTGGGRIINISSILGIVPAAYSAHYAASKHALEGYSESLDHELRASNIRVSLVEQGYIRTVFNQIGLAPDALSEEYDQARAGAHANLPDVVAKVLVLAATAKRPRHRYAASKIAKQISLLCRFAPAKFFDKTLSKELRLPV